jgi:hypothetical protein
LATADYLGQLAAPDYPEKLEKLFAEFEESETFVNVPPSERAFKSPQHLIEQTPKFWERFVLPRLEDDFKGVYRYLATPYPEGPNPYMLAATRNIAAIKSRISALAPR